MRIGPSDRTKFFKNDKDEKTIENLSIYSKINVGLFKTDWSSKYFFIFVKTPDSTGTTIHTLQMHKRNNYKVGEGTSTTNKVLATPLHFVVCVYSLS